MPIGGLSFGEMILIFAVLLLLFGPKRLPELAAGMGKGIRDFKRSLNGLDARPIEAPAAESYLTAPIAAEPTAAATAAAAITPGLDAAVPAVPPAAPSPEA
jgi:sec-independent protein translocase protein TatA